MGQREGEEKTVKRLKYWVKLQKFRSLLSLDFYQLLRLHEWYVPNVKIIDLNGIF